MQAKNNAFDYTPAEWNKEALPDIKQKICQIKFNKSRYSSQWTNIGTICPGRRDPFYIVSYYIKLVTTSWTHSIKTKKVQLCMKNLNLFFSVFALFMDSFRVNIYILTLNSLSFFLLVLREAAKTKVLFLVVWPLRPYPGHLYRASKKIFFPS